MTEPGRDLDAFVAQWEYLCCGTPLAMHRVVELTASPIHGPPLPTPPGCPPVYTSVGHHIPTDSMRHISAEVLGIWEVRQQYTTRPQTPGRFPVPDTEEFARVSRMETSETSWHPARRGGIPTGWLVHLRVLAELAPPPADGLYGGE